MAFQAFEAKCLINRLLLL